MNLDHWADFWRKLENLLRGGMPLMDGLKFLRAQSVRERAYLDTLVARLEAGECFSAAAGQGRALWRGILLSGERAGDLGGAIGALAQRLEGLSSLRGKMLSALAYPGFILVLCLGLAWLVGSFVVPRFGQLFASLGVSGGLPPITMAVFGFSDFLRHYGGVAVFSLAGLAWLLWVLRGRLAERYEKILLSLPMAGGLYRMAVSEELLASLSLLLKNHLPPDEALRVCSEASSSPTAKTELAKAAAKVAEGDPLGLALSGSRFFGASELELITIGERSGRLAETAERIRGIKTERFERELALATRLVEPFLIVLMALFVAVLLTALFAPLLPLVGRLAEGA